MPNQALPGGCYRISAEENAVLCAAVGSTPAADGRAHPIFYYIAGQLAMGLSVAQLCELFQFDVAAGPLLSQSNVTFTEELRVGDEYRVTGEILSLVRKASRKFGALDLLTYRLTLTGPHGNRAAECTNQWVLPRTGAAAP